MISGRMFDLQLQDQLTTLAMMEARLPAAARRCRRRRSRALYAIAVERLHAGDVTAARNHFRGSFGERWWWRPLAGLILSAVPTLGARVVRNARGEK
jgi:hypothetical protein